MLDAACSSVHANFFKFLLHCHLDCHYTAVKKNDAGIRKNARGKMNMHTRINETAPTNVQLVLPAADKPIERMLAHANCFLPPVSDPFVKHSFHVAEEQQPMS